MPGRSIDDAATCDGLALSWPWAETGGSHCNSMSRLCVHANDDCGVSTADDQDSREPRLAIVRPVVLLGRHIPPGQRKLEAREKIDVAFSQP